MVTEAVEDIPEDVFAVEVVSGVRRPAGACPGVTAAVRDYDVPVVGQRVVTQVAVQASLLHHHLSAGGRAQPVVHYSVTVPVTSCLTDLVIFAEVPALEVYVDLAQLGVVGVVIVPSLSPVIAVRLGVRVGGGRQLKQFKYCGLDTGHGQQQPDTSHDGQDRARLTDDCYLLSPTQVTVHFSPLVLGQAERVKKSIIVRTWPTLMTLIHYPRYPELKTSYFKRDSVHLLLLSLTIIIMCECEL